MSQTILTTLKILRERHETFTVDQFAKSNNRCLEFHDYKVFQGYGHVSMTIAKTRVSQEYEIFNKTQNITSGFDKATEKLLNNECRN